MELDDCEGDLCVYKDKQMKRKKIMNTYIQ